MRCGMAVVKRLARALRARGLGAFRAARIRLSLPHAAVQVVQQGGAGAVPAGPPAFDGARAYDFLLQQCAQGPRIPGSPGHQATQRLLVRELGRWADLVAVQPWKQRIYRGAGAGQTLPMTNVFALVRGRGDLHTPPERIRPELMLCAHWDTRPVADNDPVPEKRTEPVPGANDGASGAAVLLEAARALRAERPAASVLLAFWDGEDLGEHWYGSRVFARASHRRDFARWRPGRAVLLDMVGGRGLRCTTELTSIRCAPALWNQVHAVAAALGLDDHVLGPALRIMDDHVFLNRAGIPAIVLIDYAYPWWHTTADTPDKCCARSLQVVGDIVVALARGGAAA
jgi:glutaminyl-peptide cyclotransferase